MLKFLVACAALAPLGAAAQTPCKMTLSGAVTGTLPCSVSVAKMADGYTLIINQDSWSAATHVTAMFRMAAAPRPATYRAPDLLASTLACSNPEVPGAWVARPATVARTTMGIYAMTAAGAFTLTITSVGSTFADVHGSLTGTLTYVPRADETSTAVAASATGATTTGASTLPGPTDVTITF